MAVLTEDFAAWLARADIPAARRTPHLDALLHAVFRFRQQQGGDYYSRRLLSHFLLHSDCGLKVAQIARLVGIARPTASRQQGMSSKAAIQQAHQRLAGRPHGKLLPRHAGPIAAFLAGHPKARQADLIAFVANTLGVQVSRIALYKYLKKYGLNQLADRPGPPRPAKPGEDSSVTPPAAPALANAAAGTTAPRPERALVPLHATTATAMPAPPPAARPLTPGQPPGAATPLAAPAAVIELARAIEPGQPSAPPFCSGGRTTPAPSC